MKKSVYVLLASIALSFFATIANAQTIIKTGQQVSSADTVQVAVQLKRIQSTGTYQTIYISVDSGNSGTIQFGVKDVINSSQYAWPAGSKIILTIRNGVSNLRYKASASGQKFVVTQ